MTRPRLLTSTGRGFAIAAAVTGTSLAYGQNYPHAYQEPVGNPATFHVTGSGPVGDLQGDAFLQSVEMPDGSVFTEFYRPVDVTGFQVAANMSQSVKIRGGTNATEGVQGEIRVGDAANDGPSGQISAADLVQFKTLLRQTMTNHNLTNYYDTSSSAGDWSFVIEFDLMVMDNDPDADDFGELLYFERGANFGNSWLQIQAMDENGNLIGTPLAIGQPETRATNPPFAIWRADQKMGAVAIDVSRLGVSEFKYLKVSRPANGVGGYVSGERNPDFKFLAIITHPSQLSQANALFD